MKQLFLYSTFFFFLMDWLPAQAQDRAVTGQVLDGTTQAGLTRISTAGDLSFAQGQGLQLGLRNPQAANLQTAGAVLCARY